MRVKTAVTATLCLTSVVFGQGSLTPPGTPAPMMKTLDQVEPRTPISQAGYVINSSGSYYLTADIVMSGSTPGIRISASDVSLDLCGFSVNGAGGSATGISLSPGMDNILIHNGCIRDCNFHGIYADTSTHCTFRNLRIVGNGRYSTLYYGIKGGIGTQVEHCRIADNAGSGLRVRSNSKIVNNEITDNGGDGLHLTDDNTYIANNIVKGNGDNYDLTAGNQLNILLCEVPESLDWPCSVKFAGTLVCESKNVDGITVNSDNISIDLAGHTLVGTGASSGHGIYQASSHRNLTVKNGKIVEWYGENKGGIYAHGHVSHVHGIQAATNYYGIIIGPSSMISDCAVYKNSDDGIHVGSASTVSGCTARNNGSDGIRTSDASTISGCAACFNGNDGFYVGTASTVSGCAAKNNGGVGIYTTFRSTISGCVASYNDGDGIKVVAACRVVDNVCGHNGNSGDGAGIHTVNGSGNRIEGNNVTDNDRGIDVDFAGNFIVCNTASGNTTNYLITGLQTIGPIITTPGTITSTNPWANFEF